MTPRVADDFRAAVHGKYATILADPPWRFSNRTGKMAPEHRRLSRYGTLTLEEIAALPVAEAAETRAHLYLWVPNALILEGLDVMRRWGFTYKTNLVWHKVRKDGGPDGRGVGFYFRNVTELVLFGVRGSHADARARPAAGQLSENAKARTLPQARRAVRTHRALQPRPISGNVRAQCEARLDVVGQRGGSVISRLPSGPQPRRRVISFS